MQSLRSALKFLAKYISSDVQLELINSKTHSKCETGMMKHSSEKMESAITDLKIKLEIVKLVSSFIHNPSGTIYRMLMLEQSPEIQNLETSDFAFSDGRNKMINQLSKFLSESINYFMGKCDSLVSRLNIQTSKQFTFIEAQKKMFKTTGSELLVVG